MQEKEEKSEPGRWRVTLVSAMYMRACMWQGTMLNTKFKSLWLTGLSLLVSCPTSPVAYPGVLCSHWAMYPLWWWILCVNLAGPWYSNIWSNIIQDVSVRCFWMRLTSISALLTMPKPLTMCITINCRKFWKRWGYQTTWPASWESYVQVRKQQLELDMEQQTGSK